MNLTQKNTNHSKILDVVDYATIKLGKYEKKKKIRENRELFIVFNNHLLNKYHYDSISGNQTYFKINYVRKTSPKKPTIETNLLSFSTFLILIFMHTQLSRI